MSEEQKEQIKIMITTMKTRDDLLKVLNTIKFYELGDHAIPFRMSQLMYHCNPKLNEHRYTIFTIPKKTGGERTIMAPNKGLRMIQFCVNKMLQILFVPDRCVCGFVEGRSMVDGADSHVKRKYIFNIDLKNFFSSIDQARVWRCLQCSPFNFTKEIASIIAGLCCHPMEVERMVDGEWKECVCSVLPQGAPTSPVLSNVICQILDTQLKKLASNESMRYTRYADDITFSKKKSCDSFKDGSDFRMELEKIITEQKFRMNVKKTRLQGNAIRQQITGLVVNEKVNIPKREIKKLRVVLYNWEKLGYQKANNIFEEYYHKTKRTFKGKPNMVNVVGGKLDFMKMVKGDSDSTYKKLKNRYDILCKAMNY